MQYLSNSPTISFIIPIFNTQDYLAECLESVLKQDVDKEIILIDDGSKDNSLNIALEYCKNYEFVTIIHARKNNGQSAARNKGIKLAKGRYVYFVDSDDVLLPLNLKDFIIAAEQNQVDLIKFQAEYDIQLPNRKNNIQRIFCNPYNVQPQQGLVLNGFDYLQELVKYWIPGICWTIIRRDFLIENNILFFENAKAEDQLFYVQLLTCNPNVKILDVGDVIYRYRIRKNSTITSYNPQYFVDHFIICQLLQDWIKLNKFNDEISHSIYIIMARIYQSAFGLYNQFSEEDKANYANYLSKDIYDFTVFYLAKASE